jgi:hypothetical protein
VDQYIACDFQVGPWIARRAVAKEVAACLVMVAIEAVLLTLGGAALVFEFLSAGSPAI